MEKFLFVKLLLYFRIIFFVGENILHGQKLLYEPGGGGLGFELFNALNLHKEKIVQHIVNTGEIDYYEDLLRRSIRTAIYLKKQTLKKEDIVCLCCGNHINSLVPLIASKFIGVNYTSVDPTLSDKDLVYVFNYLQPKILFIADEDKLRIQKYSKEFEFECEIVPLDRKDIFPEFSQVMKFSDDEINFRPIYIEDLTETAIIFLSSGTTGNAKGICLSHYSILGHIFNIFNCNYHKGSMHFSNFSQKFDETTDLKFMFYSPMYWVTGTYFSLAMIFAGGARVVGSIFNAEEVWNGLEKYQPDTIFLPPGQANELCCYASDKKQNTSVKVFLTGGGMVTSTHIKNLRKCFPGCKIFQGYGQTENSGLIASFDIRNPEDALLQEAHPGSCGRPMPGFQIKIVSVEKEDICGPMQQGEVRIKNRFIMNGYYKMDSSSLFDSDGWFKTGDLGYFDENHILYIVERIKEMLDYALHWISPSIIENLLFQHPAVLEGFVFGYPHPIDNEHAMAVVVLKEGFKNKVNQEEIVTFVNERVSHDMYKIRAGVTFLDKMLKTPSGKLKRIAMKRLIVDGTAKETSVLF